MGKVNIYSGMTTQELKTIHDKLVRAGGNVPLAVAYEIECEMDYRDDV